MLILKQKYDRKGKTYFKPHLNDLMVNFVLIRTSISILLCLEQGEPLNSALRTTSGTRTRTTVREPLIEILLSNLRSSINPSLFRIHHKILNTN